MNNRTKTAFLTGAAALLTFGLLSVPAAALSNTSSNVLTLESVLQDSKDDADVVIMLKKQRFTSGRNWIRQRPKAGGRGTGPVIEGQPEQPLSPFLP